MAGEKDADVTQKIMTHLENLKTGYEAKIAELEKKLDASEKSSGDRIKALQELLQTIQAQTHATGQYKGAFKCERHAEAVGWYMLGKLFEGVTDYAWVQEKSAKWIEKAGFAKTKPNILTKDLADASAMTSTGVGTGLEWIPTILGTAVWDLVMGTYGKWRPKARPVTYMNVMPTLTGDIITYPTSQGHNITESSLSSGNKALTYIEWASLASWTIQLEILSVATLGEWLVRSLARSIGKEEDRIAFGGAGTAGDYGVTGLINAIPSGGLVTAANANVKDLLYDDLLGLQGLVPSVFWPDCEYYLSGPMLARARGAKDKQGRQAIMDITVNGMATSLLCGKPYTITDHMPTELTIQAGKPFILYGAMRETSYLSYMMDLQIARDTSIGFKSGLVYFRAIHIKSMGVDVNLGTAAAGETPGTPGAMVGLILPAAA